MFDAAHPHVLPRLPADMRAPRPLPGTRPLPPADWLAPDAAFAGQMALRDALIAERPEAVLALLPPARAAAAELLEAVRRQIAGHPGYRCDAGAVQRPDGVTVPLDAADPLATAGRLVQADLCLLTRDPAEAEHRLTGAVLCFPASWRLDQKIGRPMGAIHGPVAEYDAGMARRVQRLLDGVQPGRPLWRSNLLRYPDAQLHTPRDEGAPHRAGGGAFLRAERQVFWRLPESRAVVFSIHTCLAPAEDAPAR